MTTEGFAVWVTGQDRAGVASVAEALAQRLAGRIGVELFDAHTPGIDVVGVEGAVFAARALVRHGVASVLELSASRATRDRAREVIGRFIEVHVVDGGVRGAEDPERAEVEVSVPEAGAGVERVIRSLEVLGFLAEQGSSGEYSAEEERAVIRRLKAFGYL
jgi:hypothetical protein